MSVRRIFIASSLPYLQMGENQGFNQKLKVGEAYFWEPGVMKRSGEAPEYSVLNGENSFTLTPTLTPVL